MEQPPVYETYETLFINEKQWIGENETIYYVNKFCSMLCVEMVKFFIKPTMRLSNSFLASANLISMKKIFQTYKKTF